MSRLFRLPVPTRLIGLIAAAVLATATHSQAGSQETYLEALVDFERHAETIWSSAAFPNAPSDSGYWGDGRSSGNGGIRGGCGVAVSYAVLAVAQPAATNRPLRLARLRQALNYAANTHLSATNVCLDQLRWGHGWQSALWAGSMGLACLLLENELPADTVQAVRRAIADEATWRAGVAPASGFNGDTKAEENGWNSNVLALSAAWLNGHTNAPIWLEAARRYLANTYTVADTSGDPLAAWITTITLYPDYSLENHGFYHPTYQMVAGMSMGDSLLMARLANPDVAAELRPFAEHNVLNVWSNLNPLVLDSGEFAYPSGLDWELHDFEQNSYTAWLATHFNDPLARWTDQRLALLTRYRQVVNGDGRFVGESLSNGFFREAVEVRRTAIAWLHWHIAQNPTGPLIAPGPLVARYPQVKIIAHRGAHGFFSLSYGAKIMALIEPPALNVPTNAFVATPRQPGIIGLGALGNPTAAELIQFETNSTGFTAQLRLTHGANGTTDVYVHSTSESVAIVEVPQPAPGVPATAAGSFTAGIENDPLTGGKRHVEWQGGTVTFTNRSGMARNFTNHWLCVAGRYGMAGGPNGYFRYQAASSYNRPGAAQDTLEYFPQDTLAPRYAVWFPGQNAVQTASNAARITWAVTNEHAILGFPGPGGQMFQLQAQVPLPPPYPAYALPVAVITASSTQTGYPPTNAVDGSPTSFWVSAGTKPGEGPTPQKPEWIQAVFPRQVAISQIQVHPRTANGGYGPRDIQLRLNGAPIYEGTMQPTASLTVQLPQPLYANNAQLIITNSYDPSYPTNSRNVQVVEWNFFERARPGTFVDWLLHEFSEAQVLDPDISGPTADPDEDGVWNQLEFATGGSAWIADAQGAIVICTEVAEGQVKLRYQKRKNAIGLEPAIEVSHDLLAWTQISPLSVTTSLGPGSALIEEADVPVDASPIYYRIRYLSIELY